MTAWRWWGLNPKVLQVMAVEGYAPDGPLHARPAARWLTHAPHPTPPRPYSQKVWDEFWGQLRAAALVLTLFLLAAWVVRGRAPWAP